MTPGARMQAAIEVLDEIGRGDAAEQVLTRWARRSRFAGSKDRAAVRDHVFDVLRRKRSAAAFGGGTSGRALVLGLLRLDGIDPEMVFTRQGHAPDLMTPDERAFAAPVLERGEAWNLPEWALPEFARSLGEDAERVALCLQTRAPVSLRVNLAKASIDSARAALVADGIEVRGNPLADTALTVVQGANRLRNSRAYLDGLVELQDAASQAVVAALPKGGKILDFCAGGGGKSLAMAMDAASRVFAHDADPRRMRDLASRASRAGAAIRQVDDDEAAEHAPYDLVLCDVPCSGSGAWRRAPEGKWVLDQNRLTELNAVQDSILDQASSLVAGSGTLAYVTCSVLACENSDRIDRFVERHPGWRCGFRKQLLPDDQGDGFFAAHLTRD